MGAKPQVVAVVTGDIVQSRDYSAAERGRLNTALRRAFDQTVSVYPKSIAAQIDFRLTAGDEFQFVLRHPVRALRIVFVLRSLLVTDKVSPPPRFRAAIGVGEARYRPRREPNLRPYEWDGPAFVLARTAMERMKTRRSTDRWTMMVTGSDTVDANSDVILGLIDHLQKDWTLPQWHAIALGLKGFSRTDSAARLKVAHQNISKRLHAAGWPEVERGLDHLSALITTHLQEGASV